MNTNKNVVAWNILWLLFLCAHFNIFWGVEGWLWTTSCSYSSQGSNLKPNRTIQESKDSQCNLANIHAPIQDSLTAALVQRQTEPRAQQLLTDHPHSALMLLSAETSATSLSSSSSFTAGFGTADLHRPTSDPSSPSNENQKNLKIWVVMLQWQRRILFHQHADTDSCVVHLRLLGEIDSIGVFFKLCMCIKYCLLQKICSQQCNFTVVTYCNSSSDNTEKTFSTKFT